MKKDNHWLLKAAAGFLFVSSMASCVDGIQFGDAFLEKAPGGTVTKDTVFNNAEYTRQYLNALYSEMYYGMPYSNSVRMETSDIYVGKPEALTDCWVFTYLSCGLSSYYTGTHTANYGKRSDKYDYLRNYVWETVRGCWNLIENVDNVPGLTDAEKASMKAQAKCIMASRYLDVFRHYGGVPIITASFSGTDASYELPRGSVEETVDFIANLFDEAAAVLPWTHENPSSEMGRWTRAAALAYKCRLLQFAASPLFNANEPYYPGATDNNAIWYGNYDQTRWDKCLAACQEFFTELNSKGGYSLQMATGTRPEDYRMAYRKGYVSLYSPEVLINTRVIDIDAFKSGSYVWHQWMDFTMSIKRAYCPTQEYVEMFPWSDGKPFDWDETEREGKLDEMFLTGTGTANDGLTNITLTRDPRLYEEAVVNGLPRALDWKSTGNMSGYPVEAWLGGKDALESPELQDKCFATGYAIQKFVMAQDMSREYVQWPSIRLSEMYLIYAEALAQSTTPNLSEAVKQVNVVRSRVGMKGLEEFTPSVLTDKDKLIEEILRERCCELGMEDARFFDLVRYKRADIFEQQLHGLAIYRIDEGKRIEDPWRGQDESKKPYPTHFEYEKYELNNPTRYWWTNGFDPKWYLSPFPQTEINKNYGLVQNPGW